MQIFFRGGSYKYTMNLWAGLSRSLLKFVYDIRLFLDTAHGEKTFVALYSNTSSYTYVCDKKEFLLEVRSTVLYTTLLGSNYSRALF